MAKDKLKIALVAPFEEPVPPRKYGGTERVVANLAMELTRMGHDVTVFASGNSKVEAKLFASVPKSVRTLPESRNPEIRRALNLKGIGVTINQLNRQNFDIVHNHFGWQFLLFKDLIKQPIVTTLHFILSEPTDHFMHKKLNKEKFISISKSQRMHHPDLHYAGTVYNGINLNRFDYNDKPDNYLLFLGRIHPHKGPDKAIKVAKETGHKLVIAAKIDPLEEDYYQRKIKPLIDGKQIVFVGEVAHREKVKLLKNAKAMLSTIQWDEPFGLTNIEAMACGTPVLAINRGSLPELLIDGKTGFLCKNIRQMISRVKQIDEIKREDCRRQVEDKFSSRRMAEDYLKVYRRLLKAK